jgi:dipeptidyl aminopeptidase/acylaminoacyl peptidase
MGGAVCLSTASILEIDALVTFAALVRSAPIVKALKKSKEADMLKSGIFENEYAFDISDKLSNIHNILIFHGKEDDIIPVSHALEIYKKAGESKRLMLQEKGDHRMSNKIHQAEFILEAASWFNSCFSNTTG